MVIIACCECCDAAIDARFRFQVPERRVNRSYFFESLQEDALRLETFADLSSTGRLLPTSLLTPQPISNSGFEFDLLYTVLPPVGFCSQSSRELACYYRYLSNKRLSSLSTLVITTNKDNKSTKRNHECYYYCSTVLQSTLLLLFLPTVE